jgi:GxxExxY protein
METNIIYKEECYVIIGKCMEVHNELGFGFAEAVYKDALEILFKQDDILHEREKECRIWFRDILLRRTYNADFSVFDKIILEVKSATSLTNADVSQTLNYLKASRNKLGLLVNFGRERLEYRRLVF